MAFQLVFHNQVLDVTVTVLSSIKDVFLHITSHRLKECNNTPAFVFSIIFTYHIVEIGSTVYLGYTSPLKIIFPSILFNPILSHVTHMTTAVTAIEESSIT